MRLLSADKRTRARTGSGVAWDEAVEQELLEPNDVAALGRWPRASNQQCAEGLDFLSDEIAKRPHTRRAPHVAVKDEVEVEGNHRDRAKQPNRCSLMSSGCSC
jgi:hypothetical protein